MWKPKSAMVTFLVAGVAVGCSDRPPATGPLTSVNAELAGRQSVLVSNTAELLAALSSPDPGGNIVLAPGEYELSSTLNVPDGLRLRVTGR